jgi:hypothetical protein
MADQQGGREQRGEGDGGASTRAGRKAGETQKPIMAIAGVELGRASSPRGRSVTPGFKGQSRVHLIHAPRRQHI